ncbi:peptidase M61 [Flavobacterium amniphilum]|uniref:M61 family metallopeptidase n=1 Tax=Flavobacterium amniphilum TaxID=1834035 RepID=UPI00202AB6A7|nr:peptidase M61 [Flavobacterium amniphilum]MCL9806208.1 peptidase M61 [Flavobacterium amniphilum]
MKKILIVASFAFFAISSMTAQSKAKNNATAEVQVNIDLNKINDDKLMVTVTPTKVSENEITFNIPKTVPGTYSTDNYGKYIENLKAYDAKGNALEVAKLDDNTWRISKAKKLSKVTYWVNDTYDQETQGGLGGKDVFSPAGTNIDPNCFMINTHGFVGYFSDKKEVPYTLNISHSGELFGATALVDTDASNTTDTFKASRYAELVDHPIMYTKPDYTTFKVEDMDIIISVYSPNGKFKAADITPNMEKMMKAQKKFLGPINNTKKYAVLIYLSDVQKNDAKGFGALEHTTSTTVVMPEMMPAEQMDEQLKDIVSHEFFHIVTPLGIHANEIHYFDFNAPKMSKHLWMYEGVTEYFANLFQVNQGLITEDQFFDRMSDKIRTASTMNDTMPFTQMSANVLEQPYKDQYLNVYQKGALIGMCVDMIIREESNGQRGILDLMQKLNNEYGIKKPFNDEELFAKIVSLTYPKVGEFFKTYVEGPTPIPYDQFFKRMGVTSAKTKVPGNPFYKAQAPYITVNPQTKEIVVIPGIELPDFYPNLGIKPGDIITTVNGKAYNLDNIYDMIMESQNWKEDDAIAIKIKRDGKEQELKGKVKLPYEEMEGYKSTDDSKKTLRDAWLKG